MLEKMRKAGINAETFFARCTTTPIILFHSVDDLLVDMGEFGNVWRAIPHKQKMAVITPAKHLQNFIKYKEIFSMMGHLFFEQSYQKLVRIITRKTEFEAIKDKLQ